MSRCGCGQCPICEGGAFPALPVCYGCNRCAYTWRGPDFTDSDAVPICPTCETFDVVIVKRDRLVIVRDLTQQDRRVSRLALMAAEFRAFGFADLAAQTEHVRKRENRRWWDFAQELGVVVGATAAEVRQLAASVQAEARAYERS